MYMLTFSIKNQKTKNHWREERWYKMAICRDTSCEYKKSGIKGKIRKIKIYEYVFIGGCKNRIVKMWEIQSVT